MIRINRIALLTIKRSAIKSKLFMRMFVKDLNARSIVTLKISANILKQLTNSYENNSNTI